LECTGIVLFGGSMGELIKGVMLDDSASDEIKEEMLELIHRSNEMMAVGMSVALGANMVARFACKPTFGEFRYAWELWISQKAFQVITICLIIPLRWLFSEDILVEHPWIRSLHVAILLFLLNFFFFIDEIMEYYHLIGVKEHQETNELKSIEIIKHAKCHSIHDKEMALDYESKDVSTTDPIEVKEKTLGE
jgi:hypothetical protein